MTENAGRSRATPMWRWQVARVVEGADQWCHRHHLHVRWLCDAADICYGVPPDSFGDPGEPPEARHHPGRFAMAMHRFLHE